MTHTNDKMKMVTSQDKWDKAVRLAHEYETLRKQGALSIDIDNDRGVLANAKLQRLISFLLSDKPNT